MGSSVGFWEIWTGGIIFLKQVVKQGKICYDRIRNIRGDRK